VTAAAPPPIEYLAIETAPLGENTYLLWRRGQSSAVVVDPGLEVDKILEEIARRNLSIEAILNTHGHADHIAGNARLKELFPDAPLVIGRMEVPYLSDPARNLSLWVGWSVTSPPADQLVEEGQEINYAGIRFRVLSVPGHTPGHVAYLVEESVPMLLLSGDVLFAGSIGRTDIPGGHPGQLLQSIRSKLLVLPPETQVLPGHGPVTTIGQEKWSNPFLTGPILL
jgi:hydroxyacylglutathione hydrolase